jgi:hypothetical protein
MIGVTAIPKAGASAFIALTIFCCMFNACKNPSPGISSYHPATSKNSILFAHFANQLTIKAISSCSSPLSIALIRLWREEKEILFI